MRSSKKGHTIILTKSNINQTPDDGIHLMNSEKDSTLSALQTTGYRSCCDLGMSSQWNNFTKLFSFLIRWFSIFSQQIWVSDSSRPHSTRQSSSPFNTLALTDSNAGCFTLFDPFPLFMPQAGDRSRTHCLARPAGRLGAGSAGGGGKGGRWSAHGLSLGKFQVGRGLLARGHSALSRQVLVARG